MNRDAHVAASTTASADVDYKAAWEASVKVVVAAGRFIEAEREGNAALIEDTHFGLLKALADYRESAAQTWDVRLVAAAAHDCVYAGSGQPPPCPEEWPGEPWKWCGACLAKAVTAA